MGGAWLGLLALGWAAEPSADDGAPSDGGGGIATTFSTDTEIRYRLDPQRVPGFPDRPVFNYVEQVERFTALASTGPWRLFAQVDEVALIANRYILDGELRVERELVAPGVFSPLPGESYANLEKIFVARETKGATFTLGDAYAAFGRGIAINVNRNVDIDIDTSIQGAKAVWRAGAWDVTAVAGQLNRQQVLQDNPNVSVTGDRRHAVGGLSVVRYGLGPANVGAHGVVYDFVDAPGWGPGLAELGTAPDVVVGGATVELFGVAGIDWYAEADVFGFPTDVAWGGADPEPGLAAYAAATAYVGATTWQLEGRRSAHAERVNAVLGAEAYEVSVGPTLEYELAISEDSSAAVNSNDLWGGRLRVDWAARPGELVPYASIAVFRDEEVGGLHFNDVPETVAHAVVGVETHGDVAVLANAGLRVDDRDGDHAGADRQLHGDAIVKFPLPGPLRGEVAWTGEWFSWGNNPLQQADYREMTSAASVQVGERLTLVWYTDYTDNLLVGSKGNLSDTWYGAGEVQVKPVDAVTVKAFAGAYKAGIRCSGGQCRQLPGFEGGRVSVVANF